MTVLETAADLLASRWGTAVAVHEVFVDHGDRAVIRSLDPVGRPVVIKADRDASRLRLEARALAAALEANVPVPTVYERLDGSPAILVMDCIEGQALTSASRYEQWRAVGRQLRRLHDHASPEGLPVFGGGDTCDLAVLTLWDRDRLPAVLDGYGIDGAMRDHLETLLMPYTVVRHLLAIRWLVEHGFDPTPTVTELNRLASLLAPGAPPR